MLYAAEITYNRGSEREFTWEENFSTGGEAVDWIEKCAAGGGSVSAWINNERLNIRYGKVCI